MFRVDIEIRACSEQDKINGKYRTTNHVVVIEDILNGNLDNEIFKFVDDVKKYHELDFYKEFAPFTISVHKVDVKQITSDDIAEELRTELRDDILKRYDNSEYHDIEVILNYIREVKFDKEILSKALTDIGVFPTRDIYLIDLLIEKGYLNKDFKELGFDMSIVPEDNCQIPGRDYMTTREEWVEEARLTGGYDLQNNED